MSKLDCVRKALRSGDLVGRKILWGGVQGQDLMWWW